MLGAARQRASELSQVGALYPWRTINGEEASAYYAAGTAQYHINAAVAQAIERYVIASGDFDFLAGEGAEILVETARLWEDLGFWSNNGEREFHIHRVTGPDEYTTVVNDNLYTNVMARFNMQYAARVVHWMAGARPGRHATLCRRTGLTDDEVARWEEAADAMYLPHDERHDINPQDEAFLELEPWDFDRTPPDRYPLLLNFHPLVIYRHQVLKQADVVLAMFLRGDQFDLEQKRRNFEYYDPITTGDSSLSACVQAIVAAEVGHREPAWRYFLHSLYLDLVDTHGNTVDGVHVANAGGGVGRGGVRLRRDEGLGAGRAVRPPSARGLGVDPGPAGAAGGPVRARAPGGGADRPGRRGWIAARARLRRRGDLAPGRRGARPPRHAGPRPLDPLTPPLVSAGRWRSTGVSRGRADAKERRWDISTAGSWW